MEILLHCRWKSNEASTEAPIQTTYQRFIVTRLPIPVFLKNAPYPQNNCVPVFMLGIYFCSKGSYISIGICE